MRTRPQPVRLSAVAILAAMSVTLPAAAQTPSSGQVRIENFAKVSETYFRGGQPDGGDYADLAKLGVKTVINLIGDSDLDATEQSQVEGQGMHYLQIPMSTHKAPTQQQVDTFLAVVNDPASQPVFVHCVGGRHRTGVMTAVYRMTAQGITDIEAFNEMKRFKFGPDFLHPEFKKFVYDYEVKKPVAANAGNQQ